MNQGEDSNDGCGCLLFVLHPYVIAVMFAAILFLFWVVGWVANNVFDLNNGKTPVDTHEPGTSSAQPASLAESVVPVSVDRYGSRCVPGSKSQLSYRQSTLTDDMWACGTPGIMTEDSDPTEYLLRIPLGAKYESITLSIGACDQGSGADSAVTIRTSAGNQEIEAFSLAAPILDHTVDASGAEYVEISSNVAEGDCFVLASVEAQST